MGITTSISWCHATANPWIGCTKIAPECEHCYAERMAARLGVRWGAERRQTKGCVETARNLQRQAERDGERKRLFCAPMADVFDNQVPNEWRWPIWRLMRETPRVDWLVLTKRIGNAAAMLPVELPPNLWLGITAGTQDILNRDLPKLAAIPASVRFVSVEPMLEPVVLPGRVDWVICGAESGPQRRPFALDWAIRLQAQCWEAGIAFFFKQGSALRSGQPSGDPALDNCKEFPR